MGELKEILKIKHAWEDYGLCNHKDLIVTIDPDFIHRSLRESERYRKISPITQEEIINSIKKTFTLKLLKEIFDLKNNYSISVFLREKIDYRFECKLYLTHIK